jgi:hypothetical protein
MSVSDECVVRLRRGGADTPNLSKTTLFFSIFENIQPFCLYSKAQGGRARTVECLACERLRT